MPTIRLSATATKFTRERGYVTQTMMIGTPALAVRDVEVRNGAELDVAVATLAEEIKAAYAGSFYVYERLHPGQRAFSGFRQRRSYTVDRDPGGKDYVEPPPAPRPVLGGHSPWGGIDHVTPLGPHAISVATPSHGGIWVSPEGLDLIPAAFRETSYSPGPWFEEDCDWCIPYVWLGLHEYDDASRSMDNRGSALRSLERSHPACFAAWTARAKQPA